MKAVIVMFDSLNRHLLPPYAANTPVLAPNFARLAERTIAFDNFYAGSMPCMPARRELHTGRYNFLHRSWGPLEPFDDSMPELLDQAGVHTHLVSDHYHYWEDGGGTYHTRYTTWEFHRGQEGDPWKADVAATKGNRLPFRTRSQDVVNRAHMPTEADHSQTRTFDAGIEFLRDNAGADEWLVQIETFDPHEPFFSHQSFKDLYPHHYEGPRFDWPSYQKVSEPDAQVEHARKEYAALVSMCDHSLGRVLDAMDELDLWKDTLLIVNTDHGFLLGDHGWWAKNVMPWFNELVHIPLFMWDPRLGVRGERRGALAQTIDLAPTLLAYFGVALPPDMQGSDLADVLRRDEAPRDAGLFGSHGGHVNVTDGRYVYMRAPAEPGTPPPDELTLVTTHMRRRFSPAELRAWEPAGPLSFTKGARVMRIPGALDGRRIDAWTHGTQLYDLQTDPGQLHPLVDGEVELRMLGLLVDRMRWNDAPEAQFRRLGLPIEGAPGPEHLRAREDHARVVAMAEPMPAPDGLPNAAQAMRPVRHLLEDPAARNVLEARFPGLAGSTLFDVQPQLSLFALACSGAMTSSALRAVLEALPSR